MMMPKNTLYRLISYGLILSAASAAAQQNTSTNRSTSQNGITINAQCENGQLITRVDVGTLQNCQLNRQVKINGNAVDGIGASAVSGTNSVVTSQFQSGDNITAIDISVQCDTASAILGNFNSPSGCGASNASPQESATNMRAERQQKQQRPEASTNEVRITPVCANGELRTTVDVSSQPDSDCRLIRRVEINNQVVEDIGESRVEGSASVITSRFQPGDNITRIDLEVRCDGDLLAFEPPFSSRDGCGAGATDNRVESGSGQQDNNGVALTRTERIERRLDNVANRIENIDRRIAREESPARERRLQARRDRLVRLEERLVDSLQGESRQEQAVTRRDKPEQQRRPNGRFVVVERDENGNRVRRVVERRLDRRGRPFTRRARVSQNERGNQVRFVFERRRDAQGRPFIRRVRTEQDAEGNLVRREVTRSNDDRRTSRPVERVEQDSSRSSSTSRY